jgi:putative ABC transport system permease protein
MSFAVSERTREIGIRTALGASSVTIARAILRRTIAQLTIGVLIGMPLAGYLFYKVGGSDNPVSSFLTALVTGIGVMSLVALIACTAPTLRALRVEPTEALRGVD